MKSGGFEAVSELFAVGKLHQHSHLYTSDELIDFPGRKFQIDSIVPFQKKEFPPSRQKMNVSTRNFSHKTRRNQEKNTKLQMVEQFLLFFTTNMNNEKNFNFTLHQIIIQNETPFIAAIVTYTKC